MVNPLIIPILEHLRAQNSSCSLIDLVNLCQPDFLELIEPNADVQIVIFQKNFFVMNALYQIQGDIQSEGFLLIIFPMEISLVPNYVSANVDSDDDKDEHKNALTTRDSALADYYLDWSNLSSVTIEEIELLFANFWQRFRAVDKVDAALSTLGINQEADWLKIREAYQKKIITSHPDKGGSAEDFIEVRKAYEILSCRYRATQA